MMLWALLFAGGLFAGMVLMQHVGHGIATRRIALDPEGAKKGAGVIEGAVFGLLSLLLAFTFSGAVSRFDTRRHLVSEEAIRIGTAFDPIKLLPPDAQPGLRDLFKRYLDARLETYRNPSDTAANRRRMGSLVGAAGRNLGSERRRWRRPRRRPSRACLFLPSVNQMIDITRTRLAATRMHPPRGLRNARDDGVDWRAACRYRHGRGKARSWLHTIGFAAVISATAYVILDIQYPRLGLIRVDAADELLRDLRRQMD